MSSRRFRFTRWVFPVCSPTAVDRPRRPRGAVTEARRAAPAVLFLPHLRLWWDSATPTLRATLRTLMEDVPADTPLLLLATCDCERSELDPRSRRVVRRGAGNANRRAGRDGAQGVLRTHRGRRGQGGAGYGRAGIATSPRASTRRRIVVIGERSRRSPRLRCPARTATTRAAAAAAAAAAVLGDAATAAMIAEEDHALRQQRMFLRDLVTRLLYRKQWRDFASPVDDDQLPGYSKKVKEPMDLSTLLWKVDSGAYATMDAFLKDVHLIVAAAKTYWGGLEQERREANDDELDENGFDVVEGRKVVSRAHALEDTVQELAGQLDPSLVQRCAAIARHRAAASGGGGGGTGEGLPLMPGEGDRGERRSRRGADGELAEQEAAGTSASASTTSPGTCPIPRRSPGIPRQARQGGGGEEGSRGEGRRRAGSRGGGGGGGHRGCRGCRQSRGGGEPVQPARARDERRRIRAHAVLDAIDPLTDAEVATNSASFVDFLVTRCSGKPAADAEALATDLGRAVKTALSRTRSGPRTGPDTCRARCSRSCPRGPRDGWTSRGRAVGG